MKADVSGQRSEPILLLESGAFILRIATRSTFSSRATLSMIGSMMGTNWFSPARAAGPVGGVLVSTGTRDTHGRGLVRASRGSCRRERIPGP